MVPGIEALSLMHLAKEFNRLSVFLLILAAFLNEGQDMRFGDFVRENPEASDTSDGLSPWDELLPLGAVHPFSGWNFTPPKALVITLPLSNPVPPDGLPTTR